MLGWFASRVPLWPYLPLVGPLLLSGGGYQGQFVDGQLPPRRCQAVPDTGESAPRPIAVTAVNDPATSTTGAS
ncbi:hypothetical protein [Actinocrinis sp.]|uniref:hypothetical protein n=1 Tax=Actinocrinis sp. TaxID=1920516 RepID=UPI002DDC8FC0|nr:hypothetical protein [Actinocrinis sp.]